MQAPDCALSRAISRVFQATIKSMKAADWLLSPGIDGSLGRELAALERLATDQPVVNPG